MSTTYSFNPTFGTSERLDPNLPEGGVDAMQGIFPLLGGQATDRDRTLGLVPLRRAYCWSHLDPEDIAQYNDAIADETGRTSLPSKLGEFEQPIDDVIAASKKLLALIEARDAGLGWPTAKFSDEEKERAWRKAEQAIGEFVRCLKRDREELGVVRGILSFG